MISLDANNPNQVAGATVIAADLGGANQQLLVLSGTAIPQWEIDDDGNTYRETAVVNLRKTVLAVEQATVTVGLASIGNDDSTFLFATDSAGLDIDPNSQELLLTVNMALQGSHTGLARFGYQVVAIVTTQTTGISGTIRWAKSIFDPTALTAGQQAQLFGVTANRLDVISMPGGFPYNQYTPLAFGVTDALGTDGNDFTVPYTIPGAPYNQPLVVLVQLGPLFVAPDPVVGQVAGPNPVVLTLTNFGVAGVDFRVTSISIA